jgi:uncharacterized membrane protein YkoI
MQNSEKPLLRRLIATAGAVVATVVFLPAAADEDHVLARKLRAAGEILPLEKIAAQALQHKPGEMLETELENEQGRYLYEIDIVDAHGQVWELKLDARTAKLLQMERDD